MQEIEKEVVHQEWRIGKWCRNLAAWMNNVKELLGHDPSTTFCEKCTQWFSLVSIQTLYHGRNIFLYYFHFLVFFYLLIFHFHFCLIPCFSILWAIFLSLCFLFHFCHSTPKFCNLLLKCHLPLAQVSVALSDLRCLQGQFYLMHKNARKRKTWLVLTLGWWNNFILVDSMSPFYKCHCHCACDLSG